MLQKMKRYLYKCIIGKVSPVKYAKKIGVNFLGDVHLYGSIHWGSEPWLIEIGEESHITNGVKFITHDGGTLIFRDKFPDLEITKPIKIGKKVYIGNDVILMPGVSIGNEVIIGAGAIVTHDIPDNSVAVGIPARVIKSTDEYLEKIKSESLHLGNLKGQEKDKALMKYYGYKGNSKGIYF